MLKNSVIGISFLMAATASSSVFAWEEGAFKLSGFGTAAATYFSRSDADFGQTVAPDGAGRSRNVSLEPDSKFGLQAQYTPIKPLQFTVQGMTRQTSAGNWKPTLEWANVKYSISEDVAVRVGRIGHPLFMVSDYRYVGYANLALRPPSEVYNQVPFSASDVIEGLFGFDLAGGKLNIQTGYGRIDAKGSASLRSERDYDSIKADQLLYLNGTFEKGPWTFRAGYTQAKLTYDALFARRNLFETLSTFGPVGQAVRDQYEIKKAPTSFTGFGVSYDPGDWVVNAEYVMLRPQDTGYNKSDAWSVLGGYRLGKWTPYLGYAASRNHERIDASGVYGQLVGTVGPAYATAFRDGVQRFVDRSLYNQSTVSVGVRWDVYKNMALKAQYDHVNVKSPGDGFLINTASTYKGGDGDVFAVALDFIF